jgi:glycosyltransferase involved in cell wall biosynthesis
VPSYIPAWRYGGPIHSVHGLCAALAARGHRVDVATTNVDGDGDSDVPLGTPVDIDGVKVHYFRSTRLRRLYYAPSLRRFIAGSIERWQIVHGHSVFLWPTFAAARVARRFHKPYVLSPRGMLVRALIERRSPWRKRAWIALVEKRSIADAAAVHVTSALEAHELMALGLEPRRTFEISNGIDLGAGDGPAPGSGEKYILFLGRISWKKGLDRLVAAVAWVPGWTLVVAGNDDEDYWPRIAARAQELGVAARVRYAGFVSGQPKRDLIANASLLALPSYSENFGNVVLEAMAAGVPVAVSPEVGLARTVTETQSGLVVSGEPEVFGRAMAQLLADEPRRARLGANARRAASAFSWGAIAGQMEAQYVELLGEGSRRSGNA